ncbi:MAG: hypothetical protein R2831_03285 [Chitinophagaceae bacterium]
MNQRIEPNFSSKDIMDEHFTILESIQPVSLSDDVFDKMQTKLLAHKKEKQVQPYLKMTLVILSIAILCESFLFIYKKNKATESYASALSLNHTYQLYYEQ